jgi:NADH dehydrogenase [ubiquinone] 1 alpha subcomplex assembly factor 7
MSEAAQRIAATIAAQGPITIAQFMAMALVEQRSGYYATRNPFGSVGGGDGDFITAPMASQMFGELIGLWCAQCWDDQKRPARPLLVELGPGDGTLMRDALRALKLVPDFRRQIEVVLVEASPLLRDLQTRALAQSGVAVRHAGSLDAVPDDRPLFLIANEFFDALPIHQYVKTARGWCERMVTLDADGALAFAVAPVALPFSRVPANRDGAPPGGFYEASSAGEAIAEEIAHRIGRRGGAALLIDYGYATPGFGETLQAVAAHAYAQVLTAPGRSDLSAHVDFTALGDAVVRGGASACGPVEQGALLVALGIVQRAEILANGDVGSRRGAPHLANAPEILAQLDRLVRPEQMGVLFKALAIVPKSAPTPAGF